MKLPGPDTRPSSRPSSFSALPRRAGLCLAVCGAVLLAACHTHEPAAPEAKPVVALAVHADNTANATSLPAQVEARYSTALSFRVGGKIAERRVHLGDTVKAGQVLALLDPADLRNTAVNARAQLDGAEHQLAYQKQQLVRDQAQAQANLIAPAQWEQTQNAYATALAQRDSALAQMALAEDHLRYTTLVADDDGVVKSEDADTGQNVEQGQAVYHLDWSGDVDVACDAPESALNSLVVGRIAKVTLPALAGKTFEARVREVAPSADPLSRTWRVKLTLVAPSPEVRLGMTAQVQFDIARANDGFIPFQLPATALFHDGGKPAVWVVQPGTDKLVLRPVSVTNYGERTIDVVAGLHEGERVVVQGVHTVSAGEHVQVIAPLHPEDFAS